MLRHGLRHKIGAVSAASPRLNELHFEVRVIGSANAGEPIRMKQPKSVTVRLKSSTPRQLSADLVSPPEFRPSPVAICSIAADAVLFVSDMAIELGTRVAIALPTDGREPSCTNFVTGSVAARKTLSAAQGGAIWLFTCRLTSAMPQLEIQRLRRMLPPVR